MIDKFKAVRRVTSSQLDELLHPLIDPAVEKKTKPVATGLPAGPGGAVGQIYFSSEAAVAQSKTGKKVILVREETNPEDVEGMRASIAILTARGGMTSHAALVARGWGKCCIVGADTLHINAAKKTLTVDGKSFKEGDWMSLNGSSGNIFSGQLPLIEAGEGNKFFDDFLKICDSVRRLKVRANAEAAEDAIRARKFGAEGIGLFRTEHMFYGKGSEEPLSKLRKMILSKGEADRRKALNELYPFVKSAVKGCLEAMNGLPVTIRLLDPPLHEFIPHSKDEISKLCKEMNINTAEFNHRAEQLNETNPMMGHRGVRLGVTYPEITEMQIRAILEAAAELNKAKKKALPEIMVPVVSLKDELVHQKEIALRVYGEVKKKMGVKNIPHMYGTMIEIPRACMVADEIAEVAEFFSFGTNDLTQMGFGFSRDDAAIFIQDYVGKDILPGDPFQSLDQKGVGELIEIAVARGRKARKGIKLGICGEHGGDPASIEFCHKVGLDYVSCSPFRVPIARHAAAVAVAKEK